MPLMLTTWGQLYNNGDLVGVDIDVEIGADWPNTGDPLAKVRQDATDKSADEIIADLRALIAAMS